jgi:hypothetical protein
MPNTKDLLKYGIALSIVAAILLVFALGDREYGYYQLVRFAVCIAGAFTAYTAYQFRSIVVTILSGLLAILFNPFALVVFEKSTWQTIDGLGCLYFIVVAIVFATELNKKKV